MAHTLKDKVALVTGGARGIGAGIVAALAGAGAKIMIADIGVDADTTSDDWRYNLASSDELKTTLDHARANRVDPDVVRRKLRREGLCNAYRCKFRAAVGRHVWIALLSSNRCGVHDGRLATLF